MRDFRAGLCRRAREREERRCRRSPQPSSFTRVRLEGQQGYCFYLRSWHQSPTVFPPARHQRRSPHRRCSKKRKHRVKRSIKVPAISNKLADIPPDDYSWRKYGQKPIKALLYKAAIGFSS